MQREFELKVDSKIYIFCPAGLVTGGAELLHQLCDFLNNSFKKAFMVYYGDKTHSIPEDYKKYNISTCEMNEIIDENFNLLVCPEVKLVLLNNFKNIRSIVWWMSVDNYYTSLQANFIITFYYHLKFGFMVAIKGMLKKIIFMKKYRTYSISKLRKNYNILYHAYQSEYANNFLHKHGIHNTVSLSDYINPEYIFDINTVNCKENFIVYNPQKGYKFTKKLIKSAPDLNWIPLKNMTRSQVKETMLKSRLYIDFGNFPGKDRMPREAAMCGCCILTGTSGAAAYHEDLCIDGDKYKIPQKRKNIPIIIKRIREILKNYNNEFQNFSEYRNIINNEKNIFFEDCKKIFC